MTFVTPIALLGLLAIPAVILLAVQRSRRRDRYAMRYPAAASLALAAGPQDAYRRWVPSALALAALGALIFAAAHPERTVRVALQEASIVLVLDHSGSMAATDVAPTRIDAAKTAAKSFVDSLPGGVKVGFVAFSDAPDDVRPPSTDHQAALQAIARQFPNGSTATGDALQAALGLLRPTKSTRTPAAVVLLSDGATKQGSDPVEVATQAKRLHVPVYTVALGTQGGVLPNPDDPLGPGTNVAPDPQTLRRMSEITGARAFTAQDAGQLGAIYKQLGSQLGSKKVTRDATNLPIVVGFALLLGAGGLVLRRRVA